VSADVAAVQRISAVPMILRILCDTTGLGFGAVARVDDHSWTACAVLDRIGFGLKPGDQLDVLTTFCHEIRLSQVPIVIEKASEDPVYCRHPAPRLYGFESYIAVPIIRRRGGFFGTICALDPKPASLSADRMLPTLQLFAELIAAQIEVEERLELTRSALADATETGVLREQFVAVLGHDLRNPIAAVSFGLDWLARRRSDERASLMIGQMQQSCRRMSELVDNVLDFARGRLGDGIPVARREAGDLAAVLLQVVQELQAAHPGRSIRSEIELCSPVYCDPPRIGQLLSNLLANALTHGAQDQPVQVTAHSGSGGFELSVGNHGPPIAAETLIHLFRPFNRASAGAANQGSQGLGLGLYIASEIARSHGGLLRVSSSAEATTFVLTMPAGEDRSAGTD
jgi:signal transduction histidine kinase